MIKFNKTTLPSNQKSLLSLDFGDGKQTWVDCSPEVKSYALQNIKAGDVVDVVEENRENKKFITKISKAIVTAVTSPTQAPAPGTTTGQPAPGVTSPVIQAPFQERSSTGKYRDPLTPEEAKTIRHQSVLSSAVQLCLCNQTQLPQQAEGLADYAIVVYRRLLAVVEEK